MSDRPMGVSGPTSNLIIQNNQGQSVQESRAQKNEKVLMALEEALPFFGNQDRVEVRQGKADKPPVENGKTQSLRESVQNFFKGLGKLLATPFRAIGRLFEKDQTAPHGNEGTNRTQGKGKGSGEVKNDQPTRPLTHEEKQEAHIASKTTKTGGIMASEAVEMLARAVSTGNISLVDKVLHGITSYQGEMTKDGHTRYEALKGNTPNEKAASLLGNMAGAMGFSFTPKLMESLTQMLPELKERFSDNPLGLAILDRFENHYDFEAQMDRDFMVEIDKLTKIDTATTVEERASQMHSVLESAFRGNSCYTSGMKALVMEHFQPEVLGDKLLKGILKEGETNPGFAKASGWELKLDKITPENGQSLLNGAKGLLDVMLDPDNIVSELGQEHIMRLHDQAHAIIDMQGVSSDLKNDMILKLFTDQVFLRNLNASVSVVAQEQGHNTPSVIATTQLVQVLLNDANPVSAPSGDTKTRFDEIRDETRQKIRIAMEHFGFPVAEPQDTDWTPPQQGL